MVYLTHISSKIIFLLVFFSHAKTVCGFNKFGKNNNFKGKINNFKFKRKKLSFIFYFSWWKKRGKRGGEFLKNMPLSGISTPSDPCFSEALYNGKLFPPHEIKLDINLVLTFA